MVFVLLLRRLLLFFVITRVPEITLPRGAIALIDIDSGGGDEGYVYPLFDCLRVLNVGRFRVRATTLRCDVITIYKVDSQIHETFDLLVFYDLKSTCRAGARWGLPVLRTLLHTSQTICDAIKGALLEDALYARPMKSKPHTRQRQSSPESCRRFLGKSRRKP